jgi:hypothetical protein
LLSNCREPDRKAQDQRRRVVNKVNDYGADVSTLHGPHPVSAQLQVKLPVRLARLLHVQAGDDFYWRLSDDHPGVLMLIPAEVVERRYDVGDRLERAALGRAAELPETTPSPPATRQQP